MAPEALLQASKPAFPNANLHGGPQANQDVLFHCQSTAILSPKHPATNTAFDMGMSKAAAGPLKQKIGSP
ncbi:MAG: hypothetical protein EBS53_09345 [Bacteroidetes bacterium]|nr:hypothetical protein [Bacteroidota bacterium]